MIIATIPRENTWTLFPDIAGEEIKEIKKFPKNEQLCITEIAKKFAEEFNLVLTENLAPGWEEKILEAGQIFTKDQKKSLETKEEITQELASNYQIIFHAYGKNCSSAFVKDCLLK